VTDQFNANLTNVLKDDRLQQDNNFALEHMERSFTTYNPSANFAYNINKASAIRFDYSGTNQLPSLTQIQPLRDNTNPLNQYLGNENLKPAFQNNASISYHSFKALEGSFKYLGLSYSQVNNALIQNVRSDASLGTNVFVWENLKNHNNRNVSLYAGLGFNLIAKYEIKTHININANLSQNFNFVNTDLNQVNTQSYGLSPQFRRDKPNGLNFDINLSPSYRYQSSKLQPESNNNGFIFNSRNNVSYYLPLKMKIFTEVNYQYEAPTQALKDKFERVIINPGISKKFLKNEGLEASFIINDLLNQNVGFSRTQSGAMFQQSRFDTIRRYYMIRLSWDFSKMFVKTEQ